MRATSIWHKLTVLWHMLHIILYNAIGLTKVRCHTWQHHISFLRNEFLDTCSIDCCHWGASLSILIVVRHIVCAKCRHGTIWQPVTWTSHHCPTLPAVVSRCLLLTLLQARPVFWVGHCAELMQLCFFCTYASNNVGVNTRATCHICQQHLKFQHLG